MQKPFFTNCSFVLGLAKTHLGQPLPAMIWGRPNVSSYDPIGTIGSWHTTIEPNDMPALLVVMLAVTTLTTIGGVLAESGGTGVNRAPFCAQPSAGADSELARLARADVTKAPNVIQNDNGRRTAATTISPVFEAGPINAVVYGVKCDGSSDDSAAFVVAQAASVASGRPLQWPPGVCILDNVTLESNATHIGAKSGTTWLRKPNSTARAFLYGNGIHSLTLQSIKVDGNQVNETQGANNIQCARSCYNLTLDGVTSTNARYAAGYGDGFFASASADIFNGTKTRILNSNLSGNGGNGLEVQGGGGYVVDKFSASNNARSGITFATNAFPPILGISDYLTITNGDASQNGVDGISVGGFYTGGTPARPIWGPGTPQSRNGVISGNRAVANGRYGVVWQGDSGSITKNTVRRNGSPNGGGGILFNASHSTLSYNTADDNDNYNVDAGGATYSTISRNTLKNVDVTAGGRGVGLNVGGGLNINVNHNDIYNNIGISIYAIGVEGAGQGSIFEQNSYGLNIKDNMIVMPGGTSSGIIVSQGADYVIVRDNSVYGAAAGYAFNLQGGSGAHSLFSLQESGNVDWSNGGPRPTVLSTANLVIPDAGADEYVSGVSPVSRIDTQSSNFYAGKVRWVVPRNSVGRAYNADRPPIVTFSGGGCTITPTGTAMISNGGAFVGVRMTNYGNGCTSPPTVSLSSGMSTGTAQVGLNNYRDREITLHFLAAASVVTGGNLDLSSAGAFKAKSGCQLKLRGTVKGWYEIGRNC